ncbi:MAG: isoprenylcysteine carboxylmethyltransferase family protein [Flavisolibacter sp.]|nr:isoprenylcysteine carboxylmethyltransferase family protein [Flavisolibacter sp.]
MQHLLLGVLWIVFCALHSLLASGWLKRKLQQRMGASYRYFRLYYTLFAFTTFIAILSYQVSIPSPFLFDRNIVFLIAGGAVLLVGCIIMLLCIKKYFASLSGLKTLLSETADKNVLLITGIHRYVRHPLYMGTFLFIWGLFLVMPYLSLLIADCIITGYTLLGIKWEEEKLVKEFGNAYKRYQQTVPKLIPFLRKGA